MATAVRTVMTTPVVVPPANPGTSSAQAPTTLPPTAKNHDTERVAARRSRAGSTGPRDAARRHRATLCHTQVGSAVRAGT
ncbi:hypothetical protein GCM10007977_065860 [Dactylosporangium sucinum]|uniref:Uncharacterized protein n=1 Tax=Dactylosporangium sucinum TaxID=1424081 RepID=A0A917X247_9ACTN|nr:hypothetical protein GCM10007977_065860 [Dactylosporangium sucinum]